MSSSKHHSLEGRVFFLFSVECQKILWKFNTTTLEEKKDGQVLRILGETTIWFQHVSTAIKNHKLSCFFAHPREIEQMVFVMSNCISVGFNHVQLYFACRFAEDKKDQSTTSHLWVGTWYCETTSGCLDHLGGLHYLCWSWVIEIFVIAHTFLNQCNVFFLLWLNYLFLEAFFQGPSAQGHRLSSKKSAFYQGLLYSGIKVSTVLLHYTCLLNCLLGSRTIYFQPWWFFGD